MGKVSRFVRAGALVAIAGLLMGGGEPPPVPDPCGDPTDQPEQVFGVYVSEFESEFPLDEATCDKLASQATAACHKAVSDCTACLERLLGSVFKAKKLVCGTEEDPKACVAAAKAEIDEIETGLDFQSQQGHAVCDGKFLGAILTECALLEEF
jgi:hypothetical protein